MGIKFWKRSSFELKLRPAEVNTKACNDASVVEKRARVMVASFFFLALVSSMYLFQVWFNSSLRHWFVIKDKKRKKKRISSDVTMWQANNRLTLKMFYRWFVDGTIGSRCKINFESSNVYLILYINNDNNNNDDDDVDDKHHNVVFLSST